MKVFAGDDEPVAAVCRDCDDKEKAEAMELSAKASIEAAKLMKARPVLYLAEIAMNRGLPRLHASCSFENWEGQRPDIMPAILTGKTGVGKTHLAAAYMKEWIIRKARPQLNEAKNQSDANEALEKAAQGCEFIPAIDLVWEMRAKAGKKEDLDEVMYMHCSKEFVILDDLGAERQTEWAVEVLTKLVFTRHAERRATLFTSNLSLSQISEVFGDRTASRILDYGKPYEIASLKDWRRTKPAKINEGTGL